jgi:hypothetical protein
MRSRVRLRRLATAAAFSLILLTGCGGDEDGEATDDPTTTEAPTEPTETTEPTEATEPTDSPEPSEESPPTATEPPEPTDGPTSPPGGLRAALLTADTLPAPGDVAWGPVTTKRGTGPDGISICQVVELHSLGATRGVTSRFRSGSVSASQVVAQFVDEQGSSQGYDVLQAWLGGCAKQARTRGFDQVEAPRALTPVDAGDAAGWALVSYGPVPGDPDASYIETQSLVRVGDTLSWVVWKQTGQDYNYEEGQAPPELAIPLMAEALTGS